MAAGDGADLFEFIPLRSTFHKTFLDREIPEEVKFSSPQCSHLNP